LVLWPWALQRQPSPRGASVVLLVLVVLLPLVALLVSLVLLASVVLL
jgi:hypothetical protein